jgi:hypothetical protein
MHKSIHTLWNEYEFGIGGQKPAKEFTSVERDRVKYGYHRQKGCLGCDCRALQEWEEWLQTLHATKYTRFMAETYLLQMLTIV